jgi:mono/diheme cytochrome c family protein
MRRLVLLNVAVALAFAACDRIPGKPDPAHKWEPPSAMMDFDTLYSENCAACHALEPGALAAARPMNGALYLKFIGKENLRDAITHGVPATTMPGFLDTHGGSLTAAQIDAVTDGIMERADGAKAPATPLPPYRAPLGDASAGATAYAQFCASCHGADGTGGEGGGSVVAPAFLSLVTDQSLRTTVVAGRPELGMPDYTGLVEGTPPTDREIADIVAWLSGKRPDNSQVTVASAKPTE